MVEAALTQTDDITGIAFGVEREMDG